MTARIVSSGQSTSRQYRWTPRVGDIVIYAEAVAERRRGISPAAAADSYFYQQLRLNGHSGVE